MADKEVRKCSNCGYLTKATIQDLKPIPAKCSITGKPQEGLKPCWLHKFDYEMPDRRK